jgi:TolB protein
MAEKERKGAFWTTVPGILTGLAALLGAIASLIGGLAALGLIGTDGPPRDGKAETETPGTEELGKTSIVFLSDKTGDCEVHLVSADGTREEQVTKNTAVELRPDWSPTGKELAFASKQDGDFDVYVLEVATGQQRLLVNTEADEKAPTWSPNGEQIAFSSTLDGHSEIWAMDSAGSEEPVELTHQDAKSVSPDWSPDDEAIAFASNADGDFDIYVMDSDGTDLRNLTGELFEGSRAYEFDPSWSSDGERISFDVRKGSESFDVYVIDPDGSDLQNLTSHPANDRRSSWSPDDTKIVFGTDRLVPPEDTQRGCSVDTRQMDLFTMNEDGTDPRRLLGTEADDSSPAWGPFP